MRSARSFRNDGFIIKDYVNHIQVNYQFNDIVCTPMYYGEQIVKRGEYSNDQYGQVEDRRQVQCSYQSSSLGDEAGRGNDRVHSPKEKVLHCGVHHGDRSSDPGKLPPGGTVGLLLKSHQMKKSSRVYPAALFDNTFCPTFLPVI